MDDGGRHRPTGAWLPGFGYKTNIVRYKMRKDGGFYFRNVTEMILFDVRGKNAGTLRPGRSRTSNTI